MTFIIILVVIIGIIIYKFSSDKNQIENRNLQNGGLITKFPNFVSYCEGSLSVISERKMQLVMNTGSKLEYNLPIKEQNELKGHIHFGIESSLTTIAYCYATSLNGYRHKGLMREIENPFRLPNFEPMEYEYGEIFDRLIALMASTTEFQKLGFK